MDHMLPDPQLCVEVSYVHDAFKATGPGEPHGFASHLVSWVLSSK